MDTMADNKPIIEELLGKKIVVKTRGGTGIKDVALVEGEYVGKMLAFDGTFVKLEYTIRQFQLEDTKDVVLINTAYIITVQEFRQRSDQA